MSPYKVTQDFEQSLCDYTGAKYAVAVNSCTAALQLCVQWFGTGHDKILNVGSIEIPKHTYCSVPMAIRNAGCGISWRDEDWRGVYRLRPLPVWDCARRFTSSMYLPAQFMCVSFSTSKILGDEQGGAILHDNTEADVWFRRMRFDGRNEGVDPQNDTFDLIGHHCLMPPSVAARLLLKLYHLPKHNEDLSVYNYPDLSLHPAFQ